MKMFHVKIVCNKKHFFMVMVLFFFLRVGRRLK
jgi:hypothetical protein